MGAKDICMRIGFDAKRIFHNSTGLGNYSRDVLRILHDYTPISQFSLFNTKPSKLAPKIPREKTNIIYPKGWIWKTFPSLWRLMGQWEQIESSDTQIFHGLSGEIPIALKKNKIIKVVTIHDLIFLSHPHFYSPIDRFIYKLKFQYAVRHADCIIAISKQTKRDLISYLGADPTKIHIVYQGCNAVFKNELADSQKKEISQKYNLPERFILNVGTLQERKNALSLVKAIHGTNLKLVLIGKEKKYAKRIHKYIKEHKLDSQIWILKNVDLSDLAAIYQLATVFCYPSLCEGFGIPIIEALYSGLPVITTEDGCFPEAAGPSSIFVDPVNILQIRTSLFELYSNPEQRKKMSVEGKIYAQRFSDQNVGEQLFTLYNTLV